MEGRGQDDSDTSMTREKSREPPIEERPKLQTKGDEEEDKATTS